MNVVKIESVEIANEDGSTEIHPAIPFSEFPPGPREARPDEAGKLCWFVDTGSQWPDAPDAQGGGEKGAP